MTEAKEDKEPFLKVLIKEVVKALVISFVLGSCAFIYNYYQKMEDQILEFKGLKAEISFRILLLKFYAENGIDDSSKLQKLLEKFQSNNYSSLGIIDKYKSDSLKSLIFKYFAMTGLENLTNSRQIFSFETIAGEFLIDNNMNYEDKKDRLYSLILKIEKEWNNLSKLEYKGYVYGVIFDK